MTFEEAEKVLGIGNPGNGEPEAGDGERDLGNGLREEASRLRRAYAARRLMDADTSAMSEPQMTGLFRATTKTLFGVEDQTGAFCFGQRAGDARSNLERLRRFVGGDYSAIETEEETEWRKLQESGADEEALYRFADERLKGGAKTRMDFKGEAAGGRGPGFWEILVANADAGLSEQRFGGVPQQGTDEALAEVRRRADYDKLTDDEKRTWRQNTIAEYRRQLADSSPLSAFLKMTGGLSDAGTYIVASAVQTGKMDKKALQELKDADPEQAERVCAAVNVVRGRQKSGRILFVPTDFTDDTALNRAQLNLYGFQQSLIGLATDTWDVAKSGAKWAWMKTMLDNGEYAAWKKEWDTEQQVEVALKQGLPDADGFWGAATQGFAENAHWIIPYFPINKLKAAKGAVKAIKAQSAAAEAKGVVLATLRADAILRRDAVALAKYTEKLRWLNSATARLEKALPAAEKAAGLTRWGGAAMAGRVMAFSSFAEEYLDNADAEGISRTESVPTAAIVGTVNAMVENLYVPGLETWRSPAEIKALMWSSAVNAWKSKGAAGLRKWIGYRLATGTADFLRVSSSETLEEVLQQWNTAVGTELDSRAQKLRERGEGGKAEALMSMWRDMNAEPGRTFANAWASMVDTVAETLPSSVAFGLTTQGNMKARQHLGNAWRRYVAKDAHYDAGVVDMVQREIDARRAVEDFWTARDDEAAKRGEKPQERADNAAEVAMSAAREALRSLPVGGDATKAVMDAAGVDFRTAEVMRDVIDAETEYMLYSPTFRQYVNLSDYMVSLDEARVKEFLPGYVEGSFASDAEKGLFSAEFSVGEGGVKRIVYRYGAREDLVGEITDEMIADGSELASSYEERRMESGDGSMKPWSELDESERRADARRRINGFLGGGGVFQFRTSDGKTVSVEADAVVNLVTGNLGDIGYGGPRATAATARHETFHALWRFAKETMAREDVAALYSHFPQIDQKKDEANGGVELDEAMAHEFEKYASGEYVGPQMTGWAEKTTGWLMDRVGGLIDALHIGRADNVANDYTLKGFYEKVLAGKLGTGALGVETRAVSPESGTGDAAKAPRMNAAPTVGEKKAGAAAPAPVSSEPDQSVPSSAEPVAAAATVATSENPADTATPNQRHYIVKLPKSDAKIVGRLEVVDADTGVLTSWDGDYHDRDLQNRVIGDADVSDEDRKESEAQLNEIAAYPDPLLMASVNATANDGVPWVMPNGDVFIGNHRVQGLRQGYARGNATDYDRFVREDAAKRGIEIGEDVKKPLLVFVLERIESPDGKFGIYDVVQAANKGNNRGFGTAGEARNDTKILIDNKLLPKFKFRADGSIDETKSGEAIGVFHEKSGAQEFLNDDGTLTESAQKRILDASLAALLGGVGGSAALLRKIMTNAKRLDMQGELRALMKATPELMALAETKPAFDLRGPLGEALQLFTEWRDKDETARVEKGKSRHDWRETKDGKRVRGLSWEAFMSQDDMFRTPGEETRILGDLLAAAEALRSFDREDVESAAGKKRVVDLISGYLADYAANARAVNTETEDMFGGPPASRADVLAAQRGNGETGPRFSVEVGDDLADEARFADFKAALSQAQPIPDGVDLLPHDVGPKDALAYYDEHILGKTFTFPDGSTITMNPGHFFRLTCEGKRNKDGVRKGHVDGYADSASALEGIRKGEVSAERIYGWQSDRAGVMPLFGDLVEHPMFILQDKDAPEKTQNVKRYDLGDGRSIVAIFRVIDDGRRIISFSGFTPRKSKMKQYRVAYADDATRAGTSPARLEDGTAAQAGNIVSNFPAAAQGGERRFSVAPKGRNKVAGVEYPDAGDEIKALRFSIGAKRRDEYARLLGKHRPDLKADAVLGELEKFDDPKAEKIALHWIVRGGLQLPQDAYKVEDAISVAEKAKVDPFRYGSPDELMLAHKDFKPSAKPTDPETVPEFSDRRDEGDGIVSYLVPDSHEGQAAMRRVIDTHWGEDANPWCLLARKSAPDPETMRTAQQLFPGDPDAQYAYIERHTERGLDRAWKYWLHYAALPKRVAFRNGKLLAFMATEGHQEGSEYDGQMGYLDDQLAEQHPTEFREYDSWLKEQGENGDYANFYEWLDVNYPEYILHEGDEPREEWWDRQDQSHVGPMALREIAGVRFSVAAPSELADAMRRRYSVSGVFTGSAADYDKPSIKYIGSGEGSQVYGWGLYGSNVRDVAESYATYRESDHAIIHVDGKEWKPDKDAPIGERVAYEQLDDLSNSPEEIAEYCESQEDQHYKDAAKFIRSHKIEIGEPHTHLYEQTFFTNREPGDESHLLKWYEPVSEEQRKWVVDALMKEFDWDLKHEKYLLDSLNVADGGKFYGALQDILVEKGEFAKEESAKAASEFLYRAGIDGVKYPVDSYGKTVKDGDKVGWNYVAFSDEHIRVDHKWTDGQMRFSVVSLGNYNTDHLRDLAHKVKSGDAEAIAEAGRRLAGILPKDAVLVPMPSHTGEPTTMRDLADAIAANADGATVVDALRSAPHESSYEQKKRGETPVEFEMRRVADIPQGREVYVVDNVIDTGATYHAAMRAIRNAHILALADTDRTPDELRQTIAQNIDTLLSRFDDAKGLSKKEIFAKFAFDQLEIGWLPSDLKLPGGLEVAKRAVKGSESYILDHLHNKPGHERALSADDARRMLANIDPNNEMRVVPQRGSLSLAFIAPNPQSGWDCTVIAPRFGEFYIFKTMFAQTRKPYQDKALIRYSVGSGVRNEAVDSLLRGPLASIRDADRTADIVSNSSPERNGADGGRYSVEAPRRPASPYPNLATMSDEELVAAALAARMVAGARESLDKAPTTANTYGGLSRSTVEGYLRRVKPGASNSEIALLLDTTARRARDMARAMREDLDRGVSESAVVRNLDGIMRDTFGAEMGAQANRGRRFGRFGAKAEDALADRQAKIVADAVRNQTGIELEVMENATGVNLAESVADILENELNRPPRSAGRQEEIDNWSDPSAGAQDVVNGESAAPVEQDVSAKAKAAVDELLAITGMKAEEDAAKRKQRREAAEKRKAEDAALLGDDGEGAGGGFAEGGDVAAAIRKAKVELKNPRHLALFVVEFARRYWNRQHGKGADFDPWGSAVAVQFLRKTAQDVYGKLVHTITYSRSRETSMRRVESFANIPTVGRLVNEMEFVGALINARRIRESAESMCEKLRELLEQKFGATGVFKADNEELRRRVPAELELRARYMKHIMWLTPEGCSREAEELARDLAAARSEFDEAGSDVEQSRVYTDVMRKIAMLREFGGLRYKRLADIEAAVQWWLDAAEGGAREICDQWTDREERTSRLAGVLAAAFRNPKLRNAVERSAARTFGDYVHAHMGFTHLLRDLMRFAGDKERAEAERVVEWLELEVQKAGTRAMSERQRMGEAFKSAVESIYGRKFGDVVKELMAEDERFAPFMGETDAGIRVMPTRARALQLYASLVQVGRQVEIDDPENPNMKIVVWQGGYHDNIVANGREGQAEELAKLLTVEDMNLVAWMRKWYEQNRKGLSDVSETLFGVGVYAETGNYVPVKMLLDPQGLEKPGGAAFALFPKALTPRVKNERDFDTSADILSMWGSRMDEAAQWKAHAELGLELRGIFGRAELQKAIVASHGKKAKNDVLAFVTDILSGHGNADSSADGAKSFVDSVRGWAALGALGGNVGVMLKQTTSIPAFGFEIGMVNTAKYLATAFTSEGLAAMRTIWNSEERRNRWTGGNTEAVTNALDDKNPGAVKRLLMASMVTNKFGDSVPGLVVGQGIYRDALARGMSAEDAMAYTWMLVERTQQSSRVENRSAFQRRGKLGNMIYQFLTTQQQYLQYELRALREAVADPKNAKKWGGFLRAATLNHFILSSAYYWMGELYKSLLGQEPPEDRLADWVVGMLTGPYGALYGVGLTTADALRTWIYGPGSAYGRSGTSIPSLQWLETVAAKDPARIVRDTFDGAKTWDDVLDDLGKWLGDFNATYRDLSKLYRFRVKDEPQKRR